MQAPLLSHAQAQALLPPTQVLLQSPSGAAAPAMQLLQGFIQGRAKLQEQQWRVQPRHQALGQQASGEEQPLYPSALPLESWVP